MSDRHLLLPLVTCLVVLMANGALHATTTTVAAYNLGEDDAGASPGAAGNDPTTAFVGMDAVIAAGDPTYSANTPGGGSSLSMSLDDLDDYYTTGAAYDLGTDNWGMEAWVYSTDGGNGGWAIANGRYFLGQFGGEFLWHRNAQGNVNTTSTPVVANEWHHMALVRNGGVLTAYVDGTPLPSQDRTDQWDSAFAIGARGFDGGETWAGQVDAVRLFTFEPGQFDAATDLGAMHFVPEPNSLALAGLAAFGFVLRTRRRRDS